MSTRRDRYKAALVYIRDHCGRTCSQSENCLHPACRSSYAAWRAADTALLEPQPVEEVLAVETPVQPGDTGGKTPCPL